MADLDGWDFDRDEGDEDDGASIDPYDTLADPDRRQRVSTREDPAARAEIEADRMLSDFGAITIWPRNLRRREED